MSRIDEWMEFHLTQDGWVEGSDKIDFVGLREKEIPKDRVLTLRFYEPSSRPGSAQKRWYAEVWRHPDKGVVDELVKKHGARPSSRGSRYEKREDADVAREHAEPRESN
jgi:hypothetical protein